MTQGAQSLHLLGSKVATNMALDVNATNAVQHLKQEVVKLQTENKKLTDQLNCFISLVQRSWRGDKYATTHLSNIIGIDPPKQSTVVNDGTQARPNSQIDIKSKNRCVANWERLAAGLLDREYQAVQEEIREYQQRYIQNRQMYMDAVLQDHQQNMAVIPLSRKSQHTQSVEDVDSRFIKHTKAIERMGMSHRHSRRAQSAKIKRKLLAQDQVKDMEISLNDLVGGTPSSTHFSSAEAANQPHTITPSKYLKQRPHSSHVKGYPSNTYNDPSRYAQGDLYALKDDDVIKKQRPVSASSLRDGDNIRSRPRRGSASKSERKGSSAFITQKNERSIKYEATKPVYVFPKTRVKSAGQVPSSALRRTNSYSGLTAQTDVIKATSATVSAHTPAFNGHPQNVEAFKHEEGMPDVEDFPKSYPVNETHDDLVLSPHDANLPPKPNISVRVKSAFTRRPADIDKFADEERKMKELEEDFKKTALGLQKKLGIEDKGMVVFY